jgi:CDP-glucose 4,6-dehydratase
MISEFGDIRDLGALSKSMAEFGPDIVIHMAAQPLVRLSYRDPVGTYQTNVMGTVNVLEAARAVPNLRALVCVTTDKCYENKEWPWGYRENEPMGGHDPYSNSKGCAELVTAAYRRSFFAGADKAAIASARAGNVIGGGDWAEDRLVPDILRAFGDGVPVPIRNPLSSRCPVISSWRRRFGIAARRSPTAGISDRATRMPVPCSGSSITWSLPGAKAPPSPATKGRIRTRPVT